MTHQSHDRLVLVHRPTMLCAALAIGALMLAFLGLWNLLNTEWLKSGVAFLACCGVAAPAMWCATSRIDAVFDRNQDTLVIATKNWTGITEETYRLPSIDRAMVQTFTGSGIATGSHRVALVFSTDTSQQGHPLTAGYSAGRGATELADRINGWLETVPTSGNA